MLVAMATLVFATAKQNFDPLYVSNNIVPGIPLSCFSINIFFFFFTVIPQKSTQGHQTFAMASQQSWTTEPAFIQWKTPTPRAAPRRHELEF